jgi:hypothetical protein
MKKIIESHLSSWPHQYAVDNNQPFDFRQTSLPTRIQINTMNNIFNLPNPFDSRPTSLLECEEIPDPVEADYMRLAHYNREAEEQFRFVSNLLADRRGSDVQDEENHDEQENPPPKRRRQQKN